MQKESKHGLPNAEKEGNGLFIADLHIHSKYSRATSRDCDAPHLDLWAGKKGIALVGTGDFTHPAWRQELEELLEPAEPGLYTLKKDARLQDGTAGSVPPRFVVTGEISSIYKKNGRVRKVHNLILLPGLEAAETLAHRLEAVGNIHSDGRPILGLDSRDLLELTLDACPEAVFIPAHIWTPHFSLFGAFSGFDTVEECFEGLTPHIHAVETGLSSDPPMNWRVSALDRFTLVSNSDAHSPGKLGREANLLACELSYPGLKRAVETGEGLHGTVEFFPEEGKYHLDGHRACGLCLSPQQTQQYGGKCPVCGKKITIGVQHRVEQLADRPEGTVPEGAKPFESLAPLPEVLAACTGLSAAGKKTAALYERLLKTLGPEFYVLREAPLSDVEQAAGPAVAEGLRRLRAGQVRRKAGFDGQYGRVELFTQEELDGFRGQLSMLGAGELTQKRQTAPAPAPKPQRRQTKAEPEQEAQEMQPNEGQLAAARSAAACTAVVAGPGTGKTKTLTDRIVWLIRQCGVKPADITAVTFTNSAAEEMRTRLEKQLGGKRAVRGLTVGTFHAVCRAMLPDKPLLDEETALEFAAQTLEECGSGLRPAQLLDAVSRVKNGISFGDSQLDETVFTAYCARLRQAGVRDFDDLLADALEVEPPRPACFRHLLVDEFQDCNPLQYRLVCKWSALSESLFVIGDPDQSIYGFRGAEGRCFTRLKEDRPDTREIRLTVNYRSTPEILRFAGTVMEGDGGGNRTLSPVKPSGAPVRLVQAADPRTEGIFIAKEIGRMVGGVDMLSAGELRADREGLRSFSDIAVLCRTHRQARLIEQCLRHDGIPSVISGREDFLTDDGVRGALCFFRSLLNPSDSPALKTCLKLAFRCPPDLADRAAKQCGGMASLDLAPLRQAFGPGPLSPWLDRVEEFLAPVGKDKPLRLLKRWLDGQTPTRAMERLMNMAVFHSSMAAFLDALLLGREGDLRRASGKDYASGAVRLMTLHAAKGLEFPVVFLAGADEGSIPLVSVRHPVDTEEERRLFYVGLTRAEEELVLCVPGRPSPFLSGLPVQLMKRETAPIPKQQAPVKQLSLF